MGRKVIYKPLTVLPPFTADFFFFLHFLPNVRKVYKKIAPILPMNVSACTLIEPLFCSEDTLLPQVAKLLRDHRQRRILIVNKKQEPIGIISTTDMNNRVIAQDKDASKLCAKDIMSSPLHLICTLNDKITEVFQQMKGQHSYYCPVTQNGKLYGILTYGELMRATHKPHHG